jgi:hypothetical protein
MSVLAKAAAMLAAASPQELEAMPPAERERIAETLRHWLRLVERAGGPRSGVLHELRTQRHEWR